MKATLTVVGLFLLVMTCGCPTPQNYAQVQWDTTMRQMGIVPTYPPREDLYVGDIYVSDYDPESADSLHKFQSGDTSIGIDPRWDQLHVLDELQREYKLRPAGPVTPAGYDALLKNATTQPTTEPTRAEGVFTADSLTVRFRDVGFPEFTSVSFTQGNLSALIPVEAVSIGFGASASDFDSVTIKIPSAESIAIDARQAAAVLLHDKSFISDLQADFPMGSPGKHFPTTQAATECAANPTTANPHPLDTFIWVRLITEVYYARVIDISASSKKTLGASVSGKLTASTNPATTQPTVDPNVDPVARAQALNATLATSAAGSSPNGTLQFVTASDHAISLRRVYNRPIAIGFRGYTYKINLNTGRVVSTKVISSPINNFQ